MNLKNILNIKDDKEEYIDEERAKILEERSWL